MVDNPVVEVVDHPSSLGGLDGEDADRLEGEIKHPELLGVLGQLFGLDPVDHRVALAIVPRQERGVHDDQVVQGADRRTGMVLSVGPSATSGIRGLLQFRRLVLFLGLGLILILVLARTAPAPKLRAIQVRAIVTIRNGRSLRPETPTDRGECQESETNFDRGQSNDVERDRSFPIFWLQPPERSS